MFCLIGLGRVIALELAAAGADTYALSNVQQDLDDLVKEVRYVTLSSFVCIREI